MLLPDDILDAARALAGDAIGAGIRIVCAESCTGGLIAAGLTSVPGVSAVFPGGVVAYANAVKEKLLGVSPGDLAVYGAVSREVVLAMAGGVRALLGADAALAVSGIAGPDGGSPAKPVGTVWFAVSAGDTAEAFLFRYEGDRDAIRRSAAVEGLTLLHGTIKEMI